MKRKKNSEIVKEYLKMNSFTPQSPYEIICLQAEQIKILQDLLKQARYQNAVLKYSNSK